MNALATALAIARLTALVTEDELTRPVREALERWSSHSPEFSLRERISTLAQCPRCVSVYAAASILLAQHIRGVRWLVPVLAGSEVALLTLSIRERIDR